MFRFGHFWDWSVSTVGYAERRREEKESEREGERERERSRTQQLDGGSTHTALHIRAFPLYTLLSSFVGVVHRFDR